MEYLGITIEEDEAWVISAFNNALKTLEKTKGKVSLSEEQKTMLFAFFYSGTLYGKSMQGGGLCST